MDLTNNEIDFVKKNETEVVFELMEDELLRITKATVQLYRPMVDVDVSVKEELS